MFLCAHMHVCVEVKLQSSMWLIEMGGLYLSLLSLSASQVCLQPVGTGFFHRQSQTPQKNTPACLTVSLPLSFFFCSLSVRHCQLGFKANRLLYPLTRLLEGKTEKVELKLASFLLLASGRLSLGSLGAELGRQKAI